MALPHQDIAISHATLRKSVEAGVPGMRRSEGYPLRFPCFSCFSCRNHLIEILTYFLLGVFFFQLLVCLFHLTIPFLSCQQIFLSRHSSK